jgi:GNAT superfamily N-acetyltransferase
MKVRKIKNLKILENLLLQIKDFSCENLPNRDSYILSINGEIIPCYISIKGDEILSLWVSPEYRNKGYGKFLVNSFPQIRYVTSLPSALPFWHSLGFKNISPYVLKLIQK